VEVEFRISSVVLGARVFIVFPSVEIRKDEDRDEYPVELIRFSFVVDIELDNDSRDSEYVVGACVYSMVFPVVPARIDDDAKDDGSIELATVSGGID
jgi:hypothetical protein